MNTENINIEDIKVGETYNVRMYVSHYSKGIITCSTVIGEDDIDGIQCGEEYDICHDEIAAFSPITPAPKYDPCRLFKVGDIVSPKSWHDREPWGYSNTNIAHLYKRWKCTVIADEHHGIVKCETGSGYIFETAPCFLDLVTPVEELERYIVIHNKNEKYFEVCWKDDDEPDGRTGRTRCLVTYWYHQPPMTYTEKEAKSAAEVERDRLNAEKRKEQ